MSKGREWQGTPTDGRSPYYGSTTMLYTGGCSACGGDPHHLLCPKKRRQQGTSWGSSGQECSPIRRAVKVSGPLRLTTTLSVLVAARVARSCTMTSSVATIVDRSHIFSVRESVHLQFMSVLSFMERNVGIVPNLGPTLTTEAPRTARVNGTRSQEEDACPQLGASKRLLSQSAQLPTFGFPVAIGLLGAD